MSETHKLPKFYRVACHTDHIGPGSTFVAIKGMKLDGTHYILDALARGATKIVIEQGMQLSEEVSKVIESKNAELLVVPSTRLALAELSAQAYNYPARSLKIIAITGTKGKTTTSFLVEHILKTAGFKTALLSTVENRILNDSYATDLTTPQPDYLHAFFDQCRARGVEFVIMEAAAQALSLHRLATITFDAAAFTNFSLEHSEFYATQDEYLAAKLQLFKQLSPHARVVLNADDAHVGACIQALSQASFDTSDIVFVSVAAQSKFSQNDNDSKARMINRFVIDPKQSVSGVVLQSDLSALKLEITSRERSYTCSSKALLGSFSAYNVLTAIALVEPYGDIGDSHSGGDSFICGCSREAQAV